MDTNKHKKYKAVIFDFDDTLVKTWVVKWNHHKAVAKQFYDIDLSDEQIREHWGKPFDTLIIHLYQNADSIENMRAANWSLEDQFLKEIHDGSLEVINSLLNKGIIIGIVTAAPKDFTLPDFVRLGFPVENIAVIQTADDTMVHKPDPDVFNPILEKLSARSIQKDEIVYVGDALTDFYAARDAGLDFIAVTTGLTTQDQFLNAGVLKIVNKITDLPQILNLG